MTRTEYPRGTDVAAARDEIRTDARTLGHTWGEVDVLSRGLWKAGSFLFRRIPILDLS